MGTDYPMPIIIKSERGGDFFEIFCQSIDLSGNYFQIYSNSNPILTIFVNSRGNQWHFSNIFEDIFSKKIFYQCLRHLCTLLQHQRATAFALGVRCEMWDVRMWEKCWNGNIFPRSSVGRPRPQAVFVRPSVVSGLERWENTARISDFRVETSGTLGGWSWPILIS